MTVYTIIPEEMLWEGHEEQEVYTEMEVNGVLLQVRIEPDRRATIVRLLRCSLDDYLNPAYAPGSEVIFAPALRARS
ncbi:hypothetical protein DCC85_09055 [Paenibacillus sp. CAA11]|uniref:YlzJ-like family protein n=1 Tax=Paenibacillus sp. CAA11 TaxID=1532905 RepID=UPI000D380437|nr:YlzJ-like family protein [Paenibacillus sp. CAA11]AWB44357.1 hypothetical protein DCC85_09055 [Paenibacillus sp. CAA11]